VIAVALLLAQSATDPALIARGEKIFAQNCSVGYCHGVAGAAGRGPRLRGRSFPRDYLFKVTRDGIPSSAMPAWKDRLKEDDIRAVVEYVASLATATDPVPPANPMPPGVGPATLPSFNGPPEAGRGYALFFDATRDHCGVCHALGGRGIAIGPDLSALGAKSPADIKSPIHATRSRHTLTAKLKDGEEFPAVLAEQNGSQVRLYDLTLTPPVLRTYLRSEVESLTENTSWRHNDFVKSYNGRELDDIVIYLRWAAAGK
jgi:mono/diheme cytochrome c family protein